MQDRKISFTFDFFIEFYLLTNAEEQLESDVLPYYFFVIFKNNNPGDVIAKWKEPWMSGEREMSIPSGDERIRFSFFILVYFGKKPIYLSLKI